jgi:hypothetical protein
VWETYITSNLRPAPPHLPSLFFNSQEDIWDLDFNIQIEIENVFINNKKQLIYFNVQN